MRLALADLFGAARILVWTLTLAPLAVLAQPAAFTFDKVRLHRPEAVFASTARASYRLGETLALPIGRSAEARELFRRGFQVRVFRLPAAGALPEPLRTFAPCEVYLTSVFDIAGSEASEANITSFSGDGWLDIGSGRPPRPSYYLLVVEGRRDGEPMFRLDTRHKARYFEGALRFEVQADRPLTAAEIGAQLKLIEEYWREASRQAALNRADIRCFQLQARYRTDEEELLAHALPPCGDTEPAWAD